MPPFPYKIVFHVISIFKIVMLKSLEYADSLCWLKSDKKNLQIAQKQNKKLVAFVNI